MRSHPVELQPAREFMQRMHALESELDRARHERRRLGKGPDASGRWGLDHQISSTEHEDGWFLTYLDMMTLLLVAMIVMLAFAGTVRHKGDPVQPPGADRHIVASAAAAQSPPGREAVAMPVIPAPETPSSYPAAPAEAFEQETFPPHPGLGPLAGTFPPPDAPASALIVAAPASTAADSAAAAAAPPAAAPRVAGPALPAAAPARTSPEADSSSVAAPRSAVNPSPAVPGKPADAASDGESLAAALPLDELGSEVEVIVNKRTVSLRVNSEILFDTGQADLSGHGLSVLKRMAQVLSSKGYDITVEGHTDSVPVRASARYPSNWELSSARASSVVRYLQANGIDKAHLKAVGYADTRPIGDNHDPDGRARNRRVELVIEKAGTDDRPGPGNKGQATR